MALAAADGAPLLRTLLKREESYAVHALLYLHEAPGAAARQVAAALQTPSAFTAQVLQRLVSTGLIEARQGGVGGSASRNHSGSSPSSMWSKRCRGR
jgi:predicted transcriptional regulator